MGSVLGVGWLCSRSFVPELPIAHLMSPNFCVQVEGEVTGCMGQEGSFSVKVVFSKSSDSFFIQVPFEKGLAKGREPFLALFPADLVGNSDVHSLA